MASVKSGQTHPRSVPEFSDGFVIKKPKIEGTLSAVVVLWRMINIMNNLSPCTYRALYVHEDDTITVRVI